VAPNAAPTAVAAPNAVAAPLVTSDD